MLDIRRLIGEKIEEVNARHRIASIHNYERFEEELNSILESSAKKQKYDVKSLTDWVRHLDKENKELKDLNSQVLKSDLIERRRYLRYRVYTGLGIAAVILLTGFLAQSFNIPLPLLRISP